MLNDETLEKIFSNKNMQTIPLGTQATAVHVFEEILIEIVKENKNAYVSELLTSNE